MALAPARVLAGRLDALRARLGAIDLDALLVTHLPNVFYLTNLQASAAALVVAPGQAVLITDFRYVEAVSALEANGMLPPGLELERVQESYEEGIARVLTRIGGRHTGVEATSLPLARYNWLRATLGAGAAGTPAAEKNRRRLMPTEHLVEGLRLRKDEHEIGVLREAARRLSNVAQEILPLVDAGRREWELAGWIETALRAAGFSRAAFPTIVAAGTNGARPHAEPGDRALGAGDLVVLDFGGIYDGYCVDLTRTVAVGDPGPEAARAFEEVRAAQDAAIQAVRPGVPTWAVDAVARDRLARAGLGEAFGHGTGHGLGIEVHEAPRIARRRERAPIERLAPGMTFTIEPGVYLPGRFGVRIEDDVLVTAGGCEVLTQVPREL